jgi:hypothetical protein
MQEGGATHQRQPKSRNSGVAPVLRQDAFEQHELVRPPHGRHLAEREGHTAVACNQVRITDAVHRTGEN